MRNTLKLIESTPAPAKAVRDWPAVDIKFSRQRGRLQMKFSSRCEKIEFETPKDAIDFARQLWRAALVLKREQK